MWLPNFSFLWGSPSSLPLPSGSSVSEGEPCGSVDALSGAVCTEKQGHNVPHRDRSEWGVEICFNDPGAPILVVSALESGMYVV